MWSTRLAATGFLRPSTLLRPSRLASWTRQFYQPASEDSSYLVEEQPLLRYQGKRFCPVEIGQIFRNCYRIITKLGYGACSTVWLARDTTTQRYMTLKVCVAEAEEKGSTISNELVTLNHIALNALHRTLPTYTRKADNMFEVESVHGRHVCISMASKGYTLLKLQRMFPKNQMLVVLVSDYVQRLLQSIRWLHCPCDVMHCDITSDNVLADLSSNASFLQLENDEMEYPSQPVYENDYPIYPTRGHPSLIQELNGDPSLTDFSLARSAKGTYRGWGMDHTKRAPEILLGVPWSAEIDIWSIGIMVLELLQGRLVFAPFDRASGEYVFSVALAQYISLLGPPPLNLLKRSENPDIWRFFNGEGEWVGDLPIPQTSLEDFLTALPPGEEVTKFLNFIRRILTWDPAERAYSAHLYEDSWFWPDGPPPEAKG